MLVNGAEGISDIEHVAIGNRAGRRQRSEGRWREHEAVRVIKVKPTGQERVSVGNERVSKPIGSVRQNQRSDSGNCLQRKVSMTTKRRLGQSTYLDWRSCLKRIKPALDLPDSVKIC
jgi:hypothetical protein